MIENDSQRDDVFTFNPFFSRRHGNRPKYRMLFTEEKIMKKPPEDKILSYEYDDEFLFPIKCFLDSSIKGEKTPDNIYFKIMVIYNKTFFYMDNSNQKALGYPWTMISISMKDLDE